MVMNGNVVIDYTNHRGERKQRWIKPLAILWYPDGTEWHSGPQWILWAVDQEDERRLIKGFAMSGIHGWKDGQERPSDHAVTAGHACCVRGSSAVREEGLT